MSNEAPKKFSTLKVWVQSVLPTVYDDSLSYYEVLGKCLNAINALIENNDVIVDNLDSLKEEMETVEDLLSNVDLEALAAIVNNLFDDSVTPVMDGIANVGTSGSAARADHVHPKDTSKADKDLGVSGASVNQYVKIKSVDSDGKPTSFEAGTPSGSGGTSDYSDLDNKPSVNGVTLSGNKSSSDLGVADSDLGVSGASVNQYVKIKSVDADGKPTSFEAGTPSGGGGTSDYSELSNKPSINSVTLSGNKTSSDLGVAPEMHKANSDTYGAGDANNYGHVKLSDSIDSSKSANNDGTAATPKAVKDGVDLLSNAIGIVIEGKRPLMSVSTGQYVIVRNSTIENIQDGVYKAKNNLSTSVDVTASELTALSQGGLNAIPVPSFLVRQVAIANTQVNADGYADLTANITYTGWRPLGIVGFNTSRTTLLMFGMNIINNTTARLRVKNISSSLVETESAFVQVLYVNDSLNVNNNGG